MRLRHKPWAIDMLKAHPEIVPADPIALKGHWHEEFNRQAPLAVEIGSGKGQFIIGMAKKYPELNFIGIEMQSDALVMALKLALQTEDLPNLRLLWSRGEEVSDFFMPGSVEALYLNFSDPWPKNRHAKRRLTHPNFLSSYQEILKPEGELCFKTDNRGLFEYSLVTLANYPMKFKEVSLDLAACKDPDNVITEYEAKFMAKGQRIYRLKAVF